MGNGKCETCKVDIRSSIWDKHIKSKKHLIKAGDGRPRTQLMSVPSRKALIFRTIEENRSENPPKGDPINPYFLTKGLDQAYPIT